MRKKGWGLIILVFGVFLAVRVGLNLVSLQRAGGRLQEEEMRLVQVRKENLELKERLAEVKTPEYMERGGAGKAGNGERGRGSNNHSSGGFANCG